MELNRQGYIAYTRKEYADATELFDKAIRADEVNCFAHFNKACTLSLMYGRGERDFEILEEIIRHLALAAALDYHSLGGQDPDRYRSGSYPQAANKRRAGYLLPG